MTAVMDMIYKEVATGKICMLVSLALAKAFDTIVREFLIQKLAWYGIGTTWFESYLSYRCQVVKGPNGKSSIRFTIRGCPQGSVLGSLIFNIYINDLPLVVRYCLAFLFADDTQLLLSGYILIFEAEAGMMVEKIEKDSAEIIKWLNNNGMKINANKTQLIILGTACNLRKLPDVSIKVENVTIVKNKGKGNKGVLFIMQTEAICIICR